MSNTLNVPLTDTVTNNGTVNNLTTPYMSQYLCVFDRHSQMRHSATPMSRERSVARKPRALRTHRFAHAPDVASVHIHIDRICENKYIFQLFSFQGSYGIVKLAYNEHDKSLYVSF